MKDMLKLVGGEVGPTVDIIVVTMDNVEMLQNYVASVTSWTSEPSRLIVVNNGQTRFQMVGRKDITILDQEKNLGWMGGVNAGIRYALEHSSAPYVLMMNDDTQVLDHDYGWLTKLVNVFGMDPKIAAVGPMSNHVMGQQNSAIVGGQPAFESARLSGMAMLVRKDVLREIGLLDESLPGGDDLDFSIRLRKAGYKLAICRRTFLIHHYGQTGKRLHGEYWDSAAHTEKINTAIIQKHGFRWWFNTVNDIIDAPDTHPGIVEAEEAEVLDEIREELETGKVLDLGCGGKKIHPKAIGVDFRPKGELGCGSNAFIPSGGDVVADVLDLKPFGDGSVDAIVAKHILEHVLDIPKALKEWQRVLKPGGKLVIVCPDWRFCEAMACDPSHVHALTADTAASWFQALGGWKVTHSAHIPRTFVFRLTAQKERVPVCSCHPESKEAVAA